MEKRGLGTKSTRASIIERLYTVKYLKNDPVEPSQLGMAIIDALHTYAPRITTPEMTSELEEDMTQGRRGHRHADQVVTTRARFSPACWTRSSSTRRTWPRPSRTPLRLTPAWARAPSAAATSS